MLFEPVYTLAQEPLPDTTPPPPLVREDGYEIYMDKTVLDASPPPLPKTKDARGVDQTDNKTDKDTQETDQTDNETKKATDETDQTNNESKQDKIEADQTVTETKDQTDIETKEDTSETAQNKTETKKAPSDDDQTNRTEGKDENVPAEDAVAPRMRDEFLGNLPYLIEGSEYHGLDGRYVAVDPNYSKLRSAIQSTANNTVEDTAESAAEKSTTEDKKEDQNGDSPAAKTSKAKGDAGDTCVCV